MVLEAIGPGNMDISIYFRPSERFGNMRPEWLPNSLGDNTRFHRAGKEFPSLEGAQLAIFGVMDDPGHARPRTCSEAPDAIREELYKLYMVGYKFNKFYLMFCQIFP